MLGVSFIFGAPLGFDVEYVITCSACGYRAEVEDEATVFARKEAHEAETGPGHSVRVAGDEDQPLFRGGASDDW